MDAVIQNEAPLTLGILKNNMIKAVFAAIGGSLVAGIITGCCFYFNTNNNIKELNEDKIQTVQEITELKSGVSQIKASVTEIQLSLSSTGIYTNTNKEQIKSLDDRITNIEKGQNEMLKVLYEIKARQR